jgi:hypothetical protein
MPVANGCQTSICDSFCMRGTGCIPPPPITTLAISPARATKTASNKNCGGTWIYGSPTHPVPDKGMVSATFWNTHLLSLRCEVASEFD